MYKCCKTKPKRKLSCYGRFGNAMCNIKHNHNYGSLRVTQLFDCLLLETFALRTCVVYQSFGRFYWNIPWPCLYEDVVNFSKSLKCNFFPPPTSGYWSNVDRTHRLLRTYRRKSLYFKYLYDIHSEASRWHSCYERINA